MALVAFNAMAFRPRGSGVQTYIRELLAAAVPLAGGLTYAARAQSDTVDDFPAGVTVDARGVSSGVRRALVGMRPYPGADIVHGLDVDLPMVRRGARLVCTVHDLAVFDEPSAFSPGRARAERVLMRRAVSTADAVIAVSQFTAERVSAVLGRSATVTPLAPGSDMRPADAMGVGRVRSKYQLPERFVIQVASVEPRKDVTTLAEACRRADVPLLLAGAVHGVVPDGARALGWVDQEDVPALYSAATVVAYISTYEGFGLPPVEAMACGAAVVATSVGALPDVASTGAALVPPRDLDALTAAIARLVEDDAHREQLGASAVDAAGRLSWAATAAATLGVYRSLLAGA